MRVTIGLLMLCAGCVAEPGDVESTADVSEELRYCCTAKGKKEMHISINGVNYGTADMIVDVNKCVDADSAVGAAGTFANYWFWYSVNNPDDAVLVDSSTITCGADPAPVDVEQEPDHWTWGDAPPIMASNKPFWICRAWARPQPPLFPQDLIYRWVYTRSYYVGHSPTPEDKALIYNIAGKEITEGRTREHDNPYGFYPTQYWIKLPAEQNLFCCEVENYDSDPDECEWTEP